MQTTFAIPAYPKPLKVKQADGSWITIQMYGDEHGQCPAKKLRVCRLEEW